MGKKVLITGGSGGLGQSITPVLEARGYDVSATSSKDLDVTNEQEVNLFVHAMVPDVLINLAAISIDNVISKTMENNIRRQVDTNIVGNLNLIRPFISICKVARKPGRYIYMSSILSESPVAGAGIYSASKAFNDHLMQVAAKENAKYGVTFNSIQLGYFAVGLCARLQMEIKEAVLKDIPLKRFGKPEELVNLIEMIINTEYMTGSNIKLAGGL